MPKLDIVVTALEFVALESTIDTASRSRQGKSSIIADEKSTAYLAPCMPVTIDTTSFT